MTKAITFSTRAEAVDAAAALGKVLGYPRAGRNIGSGVHVPPEMAVTIGYAITAKPDGSEFAVAIDAEAEKLGDAVVDVDGKQVSIDTTTTKTLDRTWRTDIGDKRDATRTGGK